MLEIITKEMELVSGKIRALKSSETVDKEFLEAQLKTLKDELTVLEIRQQKEYKKQKEASE